MRHARSNKLQVVTAALWVCLCLVLVLRSSRHLGQHQLQLLWTLFQPVAPALLMLVLYARATSYFEQHHIMHEECFPEQQRRYLASSKALYDLARVFALLWSACLAASAALAAKGSGVGAAAALLVPQLMYGMLAGLLLVPNNSLHRLSRVFFCRTLARVLVPLQPVTWADFLLADIMTSLAKSSSDLSRSMCLMMFGQLARPEGPGASAAAAGCGPLGILSLAALVWPYLLRLVQCIQVWHAGGPNSQLFNALKYASSLPALMLTQMEHEYHVHKRPFPLRRLWLTCMMVNSTYSFVWDVEEDWDMPWLYKYGSRRLFGWMPLPGLKGSHLYNAHWYSWLVASNLILRFSWAHRLLGDLEAHNSVLMVVALLEVVRRWQWVYVRVETELRRLGALQLLPRDSEEDGRVASDDGGSLQRHQQVQHS